jgi:membrane-associated phospholipid phosphatase
LRAIATRAKQAVGPNIAWVTGRDCRDRHPSGETSGVYQQAVVAITDLGDSALLIPASLLLACHLVWRGEASRARSFVLAIAICVSATIIAKLSFLIGSHCLASNIHSPSGHTSFSTTFYGCCAALTASDDAPQRRRFAWAAAAALIAAIAVSRILLGAHSVAEVAVGTIIGIACVGLFLGLAPKARLASGLLRVGIGFVVLVILVQGAHMTLEPILRDIAERLAWLEPSRCSLPAPS